MILEHGKSYIDGQGILVTVQSNKRSKDFPFIGDNGFTYMADGAWLRMPNGESVAPEYDLIGPALSMQ